MEFIGTTDLANRTGLSVDTIRKLSSEGVINNIRPKGKANMYRLDEVQWLIDKIDDSMSIKEYVKQTGYKRQTVYQYLNDGRLESVKIPFVSRRVKRP